MITPHLYLQQITLQLKYVKLNGEEGRMADELSEASPPSCLLRPKPKSVDLCSARQPIRQQKIKNAKKMLASSFPSPPLH